MSGFRSGAASPGNPRRLPRFGRAWISLLMGAMLGGAAGTARGEAPVAMYIFPAGGQRGTVVSFKVGGLNLNKSCRFAMRGAGVHAVTRVVQTRTAWFEGPLIPTPASQQKEDYPRDYAGSVQIEAAAPIGTRYWRVSTSQGTTALRRFVVGDLPEIVEDEIDGEAVPVSVDLPITINGRIFPREDVDRWTFPATIDETVTCAVASARIGSPLVAHLEVHGPDGRLVAETTALPGADATLRFRPPANGQYELRISDADFRGAQDFVYRLTVTKGPFIDAVYPLGGQHRKPVELTLFGANLPIDHLKMTFPAGPDAALVLRPRLGPGTCGEVCVGADELPEFLEETTPRLAGARRVRVPAVLNGRILVPGEADSWEISAHKGDRYVLDLEASRLGSSLDSILSVLDSKGKRLAICDDMSAGQTDSRIAWCAPADGMYRFRIEDRLASRGGPRYAYRLRVESAAEKPDFQLRLKQDYVDVERGKQAAVPITVERSGGFRGPIELKFVGLPPGVVAGPQRIAAGAETGNLILKSSADAKVTTADVTIEGRASIGQKIAIRTAEMATDPRDPPVRQLAVAVTVATPFKFTADYDQAYTPRGSVYVKHYRIQRNGFRGPLEVCLADHQVRHRQGVTGPTIVVPAEADSFDYPLTYAPFMEVLRTSRTNLEATGILTDPDGTRHALTYTTEAQNEQMVSVVSPGRLTLDLQTPSLLATNGGSATVSVTANRAPGLRGEVRLELVCPSHILGVTAAPVRIPAGQSTGKLLVRFADDSIGPFNMPLSIRGTMTDERGFPVTAEAPLSMAAHL